MPSFKTLFLIFLAFVAGVIFADPLLTLFSDSARFLRGPAEGHPLADLYDHEDWVVIWLEFLISFLPSLVSTLLSDWLLLPGTAYAHRFPAPTEGMAFLYGYDPAVCVPGASYLAKLFGSVGLGIRLCILYLVVLYLYRLHQFLQTVVQDHPDLGISSTFRSVSSVPKKAIAKVQNIVKMGLPILVALCSGVFTSLCVVALAFVLSVVYSEKGAIAAYRWVTLRLSRDSRGFSRWILFGFRGTSSQATQTPLGLDLRAQLKAQCRSYEAMLESREAAHRAELKQVRADSGLNLSHAEKKHKARLGLRDSMHSEQVADLQRQIADLNQQVKAANQQTESAKKELAEWGRVKVVPAEVGQLRLCLQGANVTIKSLEKALENAREMRDRDVERHAKKVQTLEACLYAGAKHPETGGPPVGFVVQTQFDDLEREVAVLKAELVSAGEANAELKGKLKRWQRGWPELPRPMITNFNRHLYGM